MATIYDDISDLNWPRIRLLELSPSADPDAEIECKIVTYELSSSTLSQYAALSYVWGDASEKRSIICNGVEMDITVNLWTALLHLRNPDGAWSLWVDALCIDQSNLAERSAQVTLMGDIYRGATITLIWLGTPDVFAEGVMELCQQKQTEQDGGERMQKIIDNTEALDHILGFLARPWWTRSWVIQELCLSRDPMLMVGHTTIPWHLFGSIINQVNGEVTATTPVGRLEEPSFDNRIVLIMLHFMRSDGFVGARGLNIKKIQMDNGEEQSSLLDLLAEFRNFATTDQRDKVYALLSLVTGPYEGVRPDYTISANECYTKTAFAILKSSQNLRLFETLTMFQRHRDPSLPSWVPQWDSESRNDEPGKRLLSHVQSANHSGDGVRAWTQQLEASMHGKIQTLEMIEPNILVLDGVVVDSIEERGLRLVFPQQMHDGFATGQAGSGTLGLIRFFTSGAIDLGSIAQVMADWLRIAMARQPYPTGEDNKYVFLKTTYGIGADVEEAGAIFDLALNTHQPQSGFRWGVSSLLGSVSTVAKNAFDGALASWTNWGAEKHITFGAALANSWDKRVVRTSKGYTALVPWRAKVGDKIVLLAGGPKPFVLRPHDGRYKLIGTSYVHGIMNGEAWSDSGVQRIELI